VRHRSFIAVAAALAVLFAAAVGVVVLDARADQRLADGVRVSGVAVGGLTPAQARAKLHRALLAPLGEPVVVHHGNTTWTLDASKAGISANVGAMVDAALERSRRGSMFARAWREATGGRVEADLPAKIAFSRPAVHRLVSRIEGSLNRLPKDADVKIDGSGVQTVPGQMGRAVQAQRLTDEISAAMTRPGARRTFVAHTRSLTPKVTRANLAERYPAVIVVDRRSFRLQLYKNLRPAESYGIAVGRVGLETPAGLYHIQNKAINPAWHVPDSDWAGDLAGKVIPGDDPTNPIKARWMGIFDGAGIHGTDDVGSIGSAASHGCIRMRIPDVEKLYDEVPTGAPVYIA
jgi:lipoprotein-anchoring transpeptidase ErfK/SrfK